MQEKATQKKPPTGEQSKVTPSRGQLKATAQSEAEPSNAPDDGKHESSGVQHSVEVKVDFVRSKAQTHVDFCSKDLKSHHGKRSTFPVGSGYLHGFVVAARAIVMKRVERGTSTCGRSRHLLQIRRSLRVVLMEHSRDLCGLYRLYRLSYIALDQFGTGD